MPGGLLWVGKQAPQLVEGGGNGLRVERGASDPLFTLPFMWEISNSGIELLCKCLVAISLYIGDVHNLDGLEVPFLTGA